jgi:hypothetical protein
LRNSFAPRRRDDATWLADSFIGTSQFTGMAT